MITYYFIAIVAAMLLGGVIALAWSDEIKAKLARLYGRLTCPRTRRVVLPIALVSTRRDRLDITLAMRGRRG